MATRPTRLAENGNHLHSVLKDYLNFKTIAILAASVVALAFGAVVISQPVLIKAILAKYKSTDHFLVSASDARIRYEPAAQANAIALNRVIDDSVQRVQSILNTTFKMAPKIYVCATQDSFNDYVYLSKNVKGAVYWGKVFLSPGAFETDDRVLGELTTHELTHYLFYSHLGEKAHQANIPLWFREGIAVFVANGGPAYTRNRHLRDVATSEEQEALLSRNIDAWFSAANPSDALAKNGTANWLLYRVGALFVHYLHDTNPAAFGKLVSQLLAGGRFDDAITASYGMSAAQLREQFAQSLLTEDTR